MSDRPDPDTGPPVRPEAPRRLRTIEAAAIAGIVHAILAGVALWILTDVPPIDATAAEITAYYEGDTLGFQGLMLRVFSMLAFLWFIAVIRDRIGVREPRFFGTVFFGGAVLYAGIVLVAGAALAAPSIVVEQGGQIPDPGAAVMLTAIGDGLSNDVAPRIAALIVLATGTLGRLSNAFPRWLVATSYLLGLSMLLLVTFLRAGALIFPVWVAIVSVVLLFRPKGTLGVGSTEV